MLVLSVGGKACELRRDILAMAPPLLLLHTKDFVVKRVLPVCSCRCDICDLAAHSAVMPCVPFLTGSLERQALRPNFGESHTRIRQAVIRNLKSVVDEKALDHRGIAQHG
jgi:hypothetical protein